MEIVIPNANIVPMKGMTLDQDPAAIFNVAALHNAMLKVGKSWLDNLFLPPVKVMIGGACYDCYVELLTAPYRMIILENVGDVTRTCWLLREHLDDAWYACSQALVMPYNEQNMSLNCKDESIWAFERIYLFVAAALGGDWFEREPVCYMTPD